MYLGGFENPLHLRTIRNPTKVGEAKMLWNSRIGSTQKDSKDSIKASRLRRAKLTVSRQHTIRDHFQWHATPQTSE